MDTDPMVPNDEWSSYSSNPLYRDIWITSKLKEEIEQDSLYADPEPMDYISHDKYHNFDIPAPSGYFSQIDSQHPFDEEIGGKSIADYDDMFWFQLSPTKDIPSSMEENAQKISALMMLVDPRTLRPIVPDPKPECSNAREEIRPPAQEYHPLHDHDYARKIETDSQDLNENPILDEMVEALDRTVEAEQVVEVWELDDGRKSSPAAVHPTCNRKNPPAANPPTCNRKNPPAAKQPRVNRKNPPAANQPRVNRKNPPAAKQPKCTVAPNQTKTRTVPTTGRRGRPQANRRKQNVPNSTQRRTVTSPARKSQRNPPIKRMSVQMIKILREGLQNRGPKGRPPMDIKPKNSVETTPNQSDIDEFLPKPCTQRNTKKKTTKGRIDHSLSERLRRGKLKAAFDGLSSLTPKNYKVGEKATSVISKQRILDGARAFIKVLLSLKRDLKSQFRHNTRLRDCIKRFL